MNACWSLPVALPLLLGAAIVAQPLVDGDVLEPSVQNEVDHALGAAPTNAVPVSAATCAFARLYATNGMDATARAISLVSSQREGRWTYAGADVTPVAVRLLCEASGYPVPAFAAVRTNCCLRVTGVCTNGCRKVE